jgi:pimeloyl-ACP methyl ester carboxylesterase
MSQSTNGGDSAPDFLDLADLPGERIAYHRIPARRAGRPGLMFLGGFMSDMTGTKATALQAYAVERGQAFLRFDYRGHGASSGRFEEGTIGAWAADAIQAFDALSEGPQILVGSSMGGWIALLLALARPERVAGLVGIAAAPDFTDSMWESFSEEARQAITNEGRWAVASDYSEEPYIITRELIEDGHAQRLLDRPVELACPVRLLQGTADTDVPWRTAIRIMERLTSSDVEVILVKDGDHRLSSETDLARLFAVLDRLAP